MSCDNGEKVIRGFANDDSLKFISSRSSCMEEKQDSRLEDKFVIRAEFDNLVSNLTKHIADLQKIIKLFSILISIVIWISASILSWVFSVFTDPYFSFMFGGIFGFFSWLILKEFT